MSDGAALLETRKLSRSFGGLRALQDVDIQIRPGEIVSLIGPNGAGKTTFFNLVAGLFPPTAGDILFQGRSIRGSSPDLTAKLGIARTFQQIRLFKRLTALENVLVAEYSRARASLMAAFLYLPTARRESSAFRESALARMQAVGIAHLRDVPAEQLSYGDQRRLEIARALATQPQLLLLDEPAAGMNPHETQGAMELFRRLRGEGITILLIEHDMKLVMGISERVFVLDHGVLIAHGPPEAVRADPRVVEAYLGRGATNGA